MKFVSDLRQVGGFERVLRINILTIMIKKKSLQSISWK
jgi:hypothetical protein